MRLLAAIYNTKTGRIEAVVSDPPKVRRVVVTFYSKEGGILHRWMDAVRGEIDYQHEQEASPFRNMGILLK